MTSSSPGATNTGRIFVTGGTGFVGTAIVKAIADLPTRLLKREEGGAAAENQELWTGDVVSPNTLVGSMDGCVTAIHIVGIIEEHGDVTFDRVIRQGTENVLQEAQRAGVGRFILMSALGAQDDPKLGYQRSKWQSEEAVKKSGIPYTIFRPSVIFGPGDGFISVLAGVVKAFPLTPVVGDGKTKFQPVQVTDVADAFSTAVRDAAKTENKTYELGGARPYTYEEILDIIASTVGKAKPKVHIPLPLMKIVVGMSKPLPKALRPPVTSEQLKMLGLDNSTEHSATQDLIGRAPQDLESGIGYVNKRA